MRELLWRLREAPKEYRYDGIRSALRWVFTGVSATEKYE